MNRNTRKIIIGIVFIASIFLLYWGINFLKGMSIFSNDKYYFVEYENVSGLQISNPVTINGFKIGQVTEIKLKGDSNGKLIVKFIVTENFDIPSNSIAKIESADLLGNKAIAIQVGNSKQLAKSGDFLSGQMEISLKDEVSLEMLPLKNKVESLLSSFDSALAVVQYIFNENTRDNLSKSFESIRITISNLERATYTIDTILFTQQSRIQGIIGNVEAITLNIKNHNKEISNVIANISKLTDTLLVSNIKSTFINAEKAMNDLSKVTSKISSGQGSLGLLLNNDSLYYNLQNSSKDLDKLLEDLKNNPDRYLHFSVFGKKSKQKEK